MTRSRERATSLAIARSRRAEPLVHSFLCFIALTLTCAFELSSPGLVLAQAIDTTLWVTNGTAMYSVVRAGNTIYIGGSFSQVGPATGGGVPLDISSASLPPSFPKVAGVVYTVVSDGAGGWYIGGQITAVGGLPRSNLAHVASDLSVSAWNPDAKSIVRALAVSGSTVYLGGDFPTVGGQTRRGLAAVDATTGAVTDWNPVGLGGPNAFASVHAMAVSGSTIYVGGNFTNMGGQARSNIAALDAATGAATAWSPNVNGEVYALVVSGTTVYVGGQFGSIGGQARNHIAALDATTGTANAWNPNANAIVQALAVSDSTVYVGGGFDTIGGQARNCIAALNATTGAATAWRPFATSNVTALAVSGSTVYAGGQFTNIGGLARNNITALDATTGGASAWNPSANGNVVALAVSGCTVYAGGGFSSIGGQTRNRIAALDAATGLTTAWDPNAENAVEALAVNGSTVYAGGLFNTIGGQGRGHIAAISAAPTIVAVQPASGGNDGAVTVTISGLNLASCTTVKLTRAGQPDIMGSGITAALSLAAAFDLRGAASGLWDVVVVNPGSPSATLPQGFTVEAVAAPQLRVDVVGPDSIRANHSTAFDLVVGNPGNVDALAVPLWITGIPTDATVATDFALAAPPQDAGEPDWSQVPDTLTRAGGRYLALVIPRVPPGSLTRRVFLTVPSSHPTFQLRAGLAPPWADGTTFRACLANNGVAQNAACVGTQLTATTAYLASATGIAALNGIGVWAKIGWQCEGAGTLPGAIAEARQALDFMVQPVEQPGTVLASCGETLRPWWRDSLVVNVAGAVDPNEKVGKHGTISSRQVIPYAIHFENDSIATASAQRVIVTDVLPATVDLDKVSLGAITFGNRELPLLPGLTSGSWDVDLGPSRDMIVRVEASFTPPAEITRRLVWSFTALERDSLLPLDPGSLDGFLPPNRTGHEGEGSVAFTVMPLEGLSTGTEIQNQGTIKFDYDSTQATEVWRNIVDNTPPASRVLPLSANHDSATFTVSWEAVGAPPDLKDFTIYAREDEGRYRVWRLSTAATADTFAGRRGHG